TTAVDRGLLASIQRVEGDAELSEVRERLRRVRIVREAADLLTEVSEPDIAFGTGVEFAAEVDVRRVEWLQTRIAERGLRRALVAEVDAGDEARDGRTRDGTRPSGTQLEVVGDFVDHVERGQERVVVVLRRREREVVRIARAVVGRRRRVRVTRIDVRDRRGR